MPANPSHAGVKRLWRRPLLASHFDYKTHESAAWLRRRPELSETSNLRCGGGGGIGGHRPPPHRTAPKLGGRSAQATAAGRPGVARDALSVKFEALQRRRGGSAATSPCPPARPPPAVVGGVLRGGPAASRTVPRTSRAASATSVALFTRAVVPLPARGSLIKERRGRDGTRGGGRPATALSGGRPEAQRARRPARAGTGRPEPGTQRPAAARAAGGPRAAGLPALRRHPSRAACPPRPLTRASPANFSAGPFVPVCCGDSSPGPAEPTGSAPQPAGQPAGGAPALASSTRPGGSVPESRAVGRDAAAQPEGGEGGSGSGWSVTAGDGGGTKGGLFTCRGTSPCRRRTRS